MSGVKERHGNKKKRQEPVCYRTEPTISWEIIQNTALQDTHVKLDNFSFDALCIFAELQTQYVTEI